ncbi:hypothetical protein K456DRAFT_1909123, partial [Colletotrichum gloeosporioides 23]
SAYRSFRVPRALYDAGIASSAQLARTLLAPLSFRIPPCEALSKQRSFFAPFIHHVAAVPLQSASLQNLSTHICPLGSYTCAVVVLAVGMLWHCPGVMSAPSSTELRQLDSRKFDMTNRTLVRFEILPASACISDRPGSAETEVARATRSTAIF